jgi:hypothetical protein
MARKKARFRISIKDNLTGHTLKVELLPWIGTRYTVRQNGLIAGRIPHANLSVVCGRLRRWLVRQAKAAYRNN